MCAGTGAACVAAGAGRGTGAARSDARAGSVQHAVDAGCAGCVGCEGHRAGGGAVRGASRGRGGPGRDVTAALGRRWWSGCWGGCWADC